MKRIVIALVAVLLSACSGPWLLIGDIGLSKPIVYGGQAAIDRGHVVDVSDWCPASTRHLAGHRSTDGSVFRRLPELDRGDIVTIHNFSTGTQRRYRLTSTTREYTCNGVWGDLVLQTTHPDGGTYMLHFSRV